MISDETLSFKFEKEKNTKSKEVLKKVYKDLKDKGYNPVNQIIEKISTYITNYNGARNAIKSLERDELLENMVKEYVDEND